MNPPPGLFSTWSIQPSHSLNSQASHTSITSYESPSGTTVSARTRSPLITTWTDTAALATIYQKPDPETTLQVVEAC